MSKAKLTRAQEARATIPEHWKPHIKEYIEEKKGLAIIFTDTATITPQEVDEWVQKTLGKNDKAVLLTPKGKK